MDMNRRELKRAAKAAMREAATPPMLAALVFCLIGIVLSAAPFFVAAFHGYPLFSAGEITLMEYAARIGGLGGAAIFFVYVLSILVGVVFDFGYTAVYAPGLVRRDPTAGIRSFFSGFSYPLPVILANILTGLLITLWSMLLIVPGIIAAYRYRLTYYLIAENPALPVTEAIAQSKRLMSGNKWRAFVLDLSFLGWFLLSIPTFGILLLWLMPYYAVTSANFFYAARAGYLARQAQ